MCEGSKYNFRSYFYKNDFKKKHILTCLKKHYIIEYSVFDFQSTTYMTFADYLYPKK